MSEYKIVTSLYAYVFKSINQQREGKTKVNTILMGSYVRLTGAADGNWTEISAFGTQGWIRNSDIGEEPGMKVYIIDVGQGDGALVEIGNNFKMLIDGGPGDNMGNYFREYQYRYYFNKGEKVHFDYVFISHFDKDHYMGLIDILNDDHYTFGTIFHNGIAKFEAKKESRPAGYNTTLGIKEALSGPDHLITSFDSIEELQALKDLGGMQDLMEKFTFAASNAISQGRLERLKRADYLSDDISEDISGKPLRLQILGPVTRNENGNVAFKYLKDESHTINGHSIVLKLSYGNRSMLFGGDLNTQSEMHLMEHYADTNPFEVDIAKSCHHGSSEFTEKFMAKINPYATIISSGDNESYSHPRADAIGCAGKYSKSDRPLVFSTELARSTNVATGKILYGMINLRCNGDNIIMAQMKESHSAGDVWDLYERFIPGQE